MTTEVNQSPALAATGNRLGFIALLGSVVFLTGCELRESKYTVIDSSGARYEGLTRDAGMRQYKTKDGREIRFLGHCTIIEEGP